MIQAVMTSPGVIEFREIPVPDPAAGELLLRMKRIGVCGSDIHVYHGKHALTPFPVVQGHEVSGIVEKAGPGVRGFRPGERVTFQPQVFCGKCYPCTHGAYHICDNLKVMGFQTTGAASEFFAVPATKVLKLPPAITLDQGAMVEPVAVAVHAMGRTAGVAGKKVLVLGAGPIGNLVAQTALGSGAAQVLITDLSDFRLEIARQCGIAAGVNPARAELGSEVRRHFGEDKADLILECVGVQETIAQAVRVARKGTDIVVVGVFGDKPTVDLGTVQDRELRLVGTLMYQEPDWRRAIQLIGRNKLKLDPLITDHFLFADYQKAYEHIEAHRDRAVKVMIVMEE